MLKACRKTAVAARRIALQMIHNTIVCAPDELRETLRKMTRMQLIRTLTVWRPDLADYRNVVSAYRITFKSLGRRYLELHDEIADLNSMIGAIVDELAPSLVARNSIGHGAAAQLLLTAGDLKPVLVRMQNGWQLGFLTDAFNDGQVAVFMPGARPRPFIGSGAHCQYRPHHPSRYFLSRRTRVPRAVWARASKTVGKLLL